ncbi:hypothetical protein MTO96_017994 [Rhipicephalus appendiculatus]
MASSGTKPRRGQWPRVEAESESGTPGFCRVRWCRLLAACRRVGSDRLSPFTQLLQQGSDAAKLTGARLVGHRSLSVHPCHECCRTPSSCPMPRLAIQR